MATFRLQHFAQPEILRSVEPSRLLALLEPYRDYLAERGLLLPHFQKAHQIDYWNLLKILVVPDPKMPERLIEALYYIDDMATPEAMDSILAAIHLRGGKLDLGDYPTPADVAVEAWLHYRDILEHKHGERHLRRRRSFEYYQSPCKRIGEWNDPPEDLLKNLEEALDAWFAQNHRGKGARIILYRIHRTVWFLVRHGEALKREETLKGGETDSVVYRPIRYDVVGYQPDLNELCVNSRTRSERDMYRKHFGLHLFGDVQFFPGEAKYSLEPLRDQGDASLVCSDVDGMDWVKLREVRLDHGGRLNKIEIRRAVDLFEQLADDFEEFPVEPRLMGAVFRVKFTGHRSPRSVTIRPSNLAQYMRDADAVVVERWLERRGFIVNHALQTGETDHEILASD